MRPPDGADHYPRPVSTDDGDSLLSSIDEVVDIALATDMAPLEPEDPWERRQRLLDSWTAIVLAIAAVATAWASFQASQWSGVESDAQGASAIARSDANRAESEATGERIVDSQMWLSWLNAYANGQERRAAFFEERFSPQLEAAQAEWVSGVQLGADGVPVVIPEGTPMDLPSYSVPSGVAAQELSDRAEASLAEADEAASASTQFVLLALMFALVLFFASIATKFASPKIQVVLIVLSLVLLGFALVRMVVLPHSL